AALRAAQSKRGKSLRPPRHLLSSRAHQPSAGTRVVRLSPQPQSARETGHPAQSANFKAVRRRMSFLAPWFLLGALAIAGPIVFHMIRQSARERMPFSSVMFLRPIPPRVKRHPKLEHLLLLLLRCLVLVLLATGFARPFFAKQNE